MTTRTDSIRTVETGLPAEVMTPPTVEGHPVTGTERLTPEERKDFQKLEKRFEKGERESAVALRDILERRLYRESYANQDDYLRLRWGHTRQWANQKLSWLRAVELLDAHGIGFDKITVDDAAALAPLRDAPEASVRAFLEAEREATERGRKRTKKMLAEAVERQERYASELEHHPDLTYAEYLDLARLGTEDKQGTLEHNLIELAQKRGPLPDSLVEVCCEKRSLPVADHLLAIARGDELHNIVERLAPLPAEWQEQNEAEGKLRDLEREAKQLKLKLHPAPPMEEGDENDDLDEAEERLEDHEERQENGGIVEGNQEPEYDVTLTGDFVSWVKSRFAGVTDGKIGLTQGALIDVLQFLTEALDCNRRQVTSESSMIVTPAVKNP
jgi:hypothetical protein